MTLIPYDFPAPTLVQGRRLFGSTSEISPDETFVAITGDTQGIGALAELRAAHTLWVGNLKPPQLPHIASMTWLSTLCIRGTRLQDLSPLGALTNLTILVIDDAVRLTSVAFLESFPRLRALYLRDLKNVIDISPLASLQELEELALLPGIWNHLRLVSLDPLAQLRRLKVLRLAPTMSEPTLHPLATLDQLEELYLNNQFPMEEYAFLAGRLPRVRCPNFEELFTPFPHKPCKRCGSDSLAILLGKGQPMLCTRCDAVKIDAHKQAFHRLRQESASQRC